MRSSSLSALASGVLAALLVSTAMTQDDPPVPKVGKGTTGKAAVKSGAAAPSALSDEDALKAAGLSPEDGTRLVAYLKLRTLSDSEQGKIAGIIKRFGADDFNERVKAAEEVEFYGPAAVGPLKAAERDADPEIAYRARLALKRVSKVPHTAVAAAAVRAILRLKPNGAASALIGFLPLADDETIAQAIREALMGLALKDGKAEQALIAALTDNSAVRRSAAYLALIQSKAKDALPQVRAAVLTDADPEAKFIGLWSLLMTTREKEFIPELISLAPQMGRGRIWQLEDLLLQMAGGHPKGGRFLKSPESLAAARDTWLNWWKEKGDKVDFAKFDYMPRTLGITDIIEMDTRGFGQGRIVSLGPDLKEKWRITGLNSPADLLISSNDRLFVVEQSTYQITERLTTGAIVKAQNVGPQPLNLFKTPDEGMLVISRNRVASYDKDGKEINNYTRPMLVSDLWTGVRLPDGDVLLVTGALQGANCIRLDSKLKDTTKTYSFGRVQNMQTMDAIDNDRILVCEFDRVAEYDLKTAKQTWKHECNSPSSCQRLFNGNTLISLLNTNLLIEVDPSGEVVWEYQAKDGLRVGRARRR